MITQPQLIPLDTFVRHTMAFLEAHVFLLQAQVVAMQNQHHELSEAYNGLNQKVNSTYDGPTSYFLSRLFVSHVSAFEIFLQDTTIAVVLKNPKKVGNVTFSLSEILDSSSPEALIRRAIDDWLNKLMYKKPSEYLKELAATLSIDDSPLRENWKSFVEAKARRDIGVHSDWKCNPTYLRKVSEVGIEPNAIPGQPLIPSSAYIKSINQTMLDLASAIASSVLSKHWPETDLTELTFAAAQPDEVGKPIA